MNKKNLFFGLAMVLVGVMVLLNALGKPGIEVLKGSDVIRLVASGGLFGVGFMGLVGRLKP